MSTRLRSALCPDCRVYRDVTRTPRGLRLEHHNVSERTIAFALTYDDETLPPMDSAQANDRELSAVASRPTVTLTRSCRWSGALLTWEPSPP